MIAMQYSFTLPADYDMDIIARRIRDKGPALDGYPDLLCKLYLYARIDAEYPTLHNLYAPLYLWRHPRGMTRFLASDGFAALCKQFGRPAIDIWIPEREIDLTVITGARFATLTIEDGAETQSGPDPQSNHDTLFQLSARDYHHWRRLSVVCGTEPPPVHSATAQHYRIGHISLGD